MSNPLPPAAPPVRFFRLRQKEVINISTCRTLGCVSDLEMDPLNGCILSLIVPEMGRLGLFPGREFEYIIPWRCIVRTGTDIILVEVNEDEVRKKCIGF